MPNPSAAITGVDPLVSVILPSYGMGKFIQQALESIGSQTYGNWEVILVDDCGPEDGTREAVLNFRDSYPAKRVEYIRNVENKGCGESRNVGMRVASGQYIALLDPDDFWGDNYLQEAVSGIGNADLCFQGARIVDENGLDHGVRMASRMDDLVARFPESLFCENFLLPSCTFLHRRVIEQVGGFSRRPELMYAADWDFYLRCIRKNQRFVFLEGDECRYRKHSGAATGNYLRMTVECVNVLRMNRKNSEGLMKKCLRASLHAHLCRLVYLKISHRDWSGLKELEEAFLLDPLNPDLPKSLIRALKNNWS